jgi:enoyl-CoA hydratase/carnithine racemase
MIIVAEDNPVWTATIAAEERRNALTRQMVAVLAETIDRFEDDNAARVLVIRGAGRVAFCAGADLKEMAAEHATQAFIPVMPRLYERILACPKPVLAMLNGDAVGGGLEMALCCDIVVASRGVRVGLPEVRLGTVPRFGAVLLARQAGAQPALALALLGELHRIEDVPCIAALIVSPDELENKTYGFARRLASFSSGALAAIKLLVRGAGESRLADLIELPAVLAEVQSDEPRRAVREFGKTTVEVGHDQRTESTRS